MEELCFVLRLLLGDPLAPGKSAYGIDGLPLLIMKEGSYEGSKEALPFVLALAE
jgi:hypothetical protein